MPQKKANLKNRSPVLAPNEVSHSKIGCLSCETMETVNNDLARELFENKCNAEKHISENKMLRSKMLYYNPRRMNQTLKRKNDRISKLLKEIRAIKLQVSKLRKDAEKGTVSKEKLKKVMSQKSSIASH